MPEQPTSWIRQYRATVPGHLSTLVYGSFADLDPTKELLEQSLGVRFVAHESACRGGDYWLGTTAVAGESVVVQCNADLAAGEPAEAVNMPTLVYIERTSRADDVVATLVDRSFVLVRRDEWPGK